jgi:hypothetical protein
MTTRESAVRRSPRGFLVAAAVAVLGLSAAVVWGVLAALSPMGSAADLVRSDLPGAVVTNVSRPGTVVLYYEGDPVPSLSSLDPAVTGPSGRLLAVTPYGSHLEYDSPTTPGVVGTAVGSFAAVRSGIYRVDSAFIPARAARLAVGPDIGRPFVQTMVGPVALGAASVLIAVLIALLTAVRVNRGYRRTS